MSRYLSKPLVSIGLPVHNGERWLREALDSIIAQTCQDWELILTDDGSTDRTLEVIEPYLHDQRIRLLTDGVKRGISYRINQQVVMAQGEFFARMDADDVMLPDRLERQVRYMQEHPEVDVSGTDAGRWTFVHPSVMGRTEWFRKHPYRSECDGCEDWDLWLRTRNCTTFGRIESPLIVYRQPEKFDRKKYLVRRQQGRKTIRMNRNLLPLWHYWTLLADSYLKSFWVWCWNKK